MKKFFFSFLLFGALAASAEVRAELSSSVATEMEAYVATCQSHIQSELAKADDALFRARLELQLRIVFAADMDRYRRKMMASNKLTTPEIEKLRLEREALIRQIHALDDAIIEASVEAPEVQALDKHRANNATCIDELKERLTLMTPVERRALEAKKASETSKN